MQPQAKCDKLVVKNGWIACPICNRNRHLHRILPDTEAKKLPAYCRVCKKELILNIARDQSVERQSP